MTFERPDDPMNRILASHGLHRPTARPCQQREAAEVLLMLWACQAMAAQQAYVLQAPTGPYQADSVS